MSWRKFNAGTPNLDFYSNKVASQPSGDLIETIHKTWFGKYDLLESHHGFIQWLFPNSEDYGVNSYASRLKKEEAEAIRADPVLKQRVLKSFHLMLDFWGMKMEEQSMTFSRATHYKERYSNWTGSHNNLRLTRAMKSLGELGWEQYKKPWIRFLMHEIANGAIHGCSSSLTSFWIPTLGKKDQQELLAEWEQIKGGKQVRKVRWVHSQDCVEQESGGQALIPVVQQQKNTSDNDKDTIITSSTFPITPVASAVNANVFDTNSDDDDDNNDSDDSDN